jgi:hypothetical protein
MSRYISSNVSGQQFAYGFDKHLQEYFLQSYDENGETVELVGVWGEIAGTNGKLLEKLNELGIAIPQDHIDQIVFDLPF